MAGASQASPSERFPIPPYPENAGTQQGELLNFTKVQTRKAQSPDGGTGPAAPGNYNPTILEWQTKDQHLLVSSGYMAFPLAMGDSHGVATITLKNYSTSRIGWVTDWCWFDLFEGNRVCLRIAFHRNDRLLTFNQVVNNNWIQDLRYAFPEDLVAGNEVALEISYSGGVFSVAFNDREAKLPWGAPADSLEYRATQASDAIFRDWVPAKYGYYGPPDFIVEVPPRSSF